MNTHIRTTRSQIYSRFSFSYFYQLSLIKYSSCLYCSYTIIFLSDLYIPFLFICSLLYTTFDYIPNNLSVLFLINFSKKSYLLYWISKRIPYPTFHNGLVAFGHFIPCLHTYKSRHLIKCITASKLHKGVLPFALCLDRRLMNLIKDQSVFKPLSSIQFHRFTIKRAKLYKFIRLIRSLIACLGPCSFACKHSPSAGLYLLTRGLCHRSK